MSRLERVTDAEIDALVSHWPVELDAEPSRGITRIRQLVQGFLHHRRAYIRETTGNLRAILAGTP